MNVPFIRKWIEALRSGLYVQALGVHKHDGGFCALGLGYELCPGRVWVPCGAGGRQFYAAGNLVVPPLLLETSGLPKGVLSHIAWHLNDQGSSFAQIADYLEAYLEAPLSEENFAQ